MLRKIGRKKAAALAEAGIVARASFTTPNRGKGPKGLVSSPAVPLPDATEGKGTKRRFRWRAKGRDGEGRRTLAGIEREATELAAAVCRARGECEAAGLENVRCGGDLQAAHLLRRGNKHIRAKQDNLSCLCAAHHRFYTDHPARWESHVGTVVLNLLRAMDRRLSKATTARESYLADIAHYKGLHPRGGA